ncbi:hypothetical protein DV515_00014461 [Chloebia gouldiae]|uniref:Uncharacterized protein n=1 Tax=Chloebia gouldiae TaxID=44316 RepID=A0A3L8RYC1_CHLGU|nr:hypothetical protein DV515_00014461 [Chloebia gouldiae]
MESNELGIHTERRRVGLLAGRARGARRWVCRGSVAPGRAGQGCARSRCLRPSRRGSCSRFALCSLSCLPFPPSLFPFPAFASLCVLCPGPAASRLPSSRPLGSGPPPPRGFLRPAGQEGSEAPRGPAGVAAAAGLAALRGRCLHLRAHRARRLPRFCRGWGSPVRPGPEHPHLGAGRDTF